MRDRREYRGYVAAEQGRSPDTKSAEAYREQVHGTLEHLRALRERRAKIAEALAQGVRACSIEHYVSFTNDPAWLVNMAINRRAGWPDDPSHMRGSCMPVNGKYPRKAAGDGPLRDLWGQLGYMIRTPRVVVRVAELGAARTYLLARIPHRFTDENGDVPRLNTKAGYFA